MAHLMKKSGVIFEIPVTHQIHIVQVFSEYLHIFIYRSVLDNIHITAEHLFLVLKSAREEINLQVETPSPHVLIEIRQVWIVIYRFVMRIPAKVIGQKTCKRRFSGPDIPRNCNITTSCRVFFCHFTYQDVYTSPSYSFQRQAG